MYIILRIGYSDASVIAGHTVMRIQYSMYVLSRMARLGQNIAAAFAAAATDSVKIQLTIRLVAMYSGMFPWICIDCTFLTVAHVYQIRPS